MGMRMRGEKCGFGLFVARKNVKGGNRVRLEAS